MQSNPRILVDLLLFWVWVACESITVFVIFLHVAIRTCTCFFFEVPPFEELQDPDSSPRREEVGRRTPRDYGGLLLSIFYHDRFQESNEHYSKTSSQEDVS